VILRANTYTLRLARREILPVGDEILELFWEGGSYPRGKPSSLRSDLPDATRCSLVSSQAGFAEPLNFYHTEETYTRPQVPPNSR
jgi:hypothetical protein